MKRLVRGMLTAAWVGLSSLAAHALEIGTPAPDFTGASTQGALRLSDLRGQNLVLAFYFADFTPVWRNELIAFQRDLQAFGKHNAQVLGVSGDTLETHQAFAKEHGITFPLIDDAGGTIRKHYGSGRVTYLIDKEGIISFIMNGVPDNGLLLKELKRQ